MKHTFARATLTIICFAFFSRTSLAEVDIDQLAATKLDWIGSQAEVDQVVTYARIGEPQVRRSTQGCPVDLPDTLGSGEFLFCVKVEELPKNVDQDLLAMQQARFDNVSDYDQRGTRLMVAKHDGSLFRFLRPDDVRQLAALLDIRSEYVGRISFSRPANDSAAWLSSLRGLYVGEDFVDKGSLFQHVENLLKGEEIIQAGFGPDEISLYPGGGFTTRFSFFISESYIIYFKSEGWNS